MTEQRDLGDRPLEVKVKPVIPESLRQGVYSNYMRVAFTPFEFVLDFVVVPPAVDFEEVREAVMEKGEVEAPVVARILVPKEVLPRIVEALQSNLRKQMQLAGPVEQEPVEKEP